MSTLTSLPSRTRSLLMAPVRLIREHLRPFLALNAMAFGLLLLGMAAGLLFPDLHASRAAGMDASGTTDLVVSLLSSMWLFAATILAVNVLTVALATITLPSLVVPFLGIALFAYRAFLFGVSLAPVDATVRTILIPHSVTLVLELEAYVLVTLGTYLLGRAWLRPASVGESSRRRGYVHGLRQLGVLWLPALALFVLGAVYEAFSITRIMPMMLVG